MKKTNSQLIRELDRQSEEAFRLYSLGMYQKAITEATSILRKANEQLGRWSSNVYIYYENLELIKTGQLTFENNQSVNNVTIQSKNKSNYILLRELNDNTLNFYKLNRYQDAYKEANKALSLAIRTFGNNHPYIKILRQNIQSLEKKKNQQEASLNRGLMDQENHSSKLFFVPKRMLPFMLISGFILLLLFVLSIVNIYKHSLPNLEITTSSNEISSSKLFEDYSYELKESHLIDAPLIHQNPELPRGCEVTSLAMMLQYAGVDVDKLQLADEVIKDPTPYQIINSRIHFGNPDYGFVGSIDNIEEPGLGVYHGPIKELANNHLPNQIIDLTGRPFGDILYFINKDLPVWVIVNTTYSELSPRDFVVWYTDYGPTQVTYKQHSVLITGYDAQYIYFNDPLTGKKNRRAPIHDFELAWNQMGKQAISYLPKDKGFTEILPID